jgi:membrane protease YdiL (CAAX protease family)
VHAATPGGSPPRLNAPVEPERERYAGLALLPVLSTVSFYALPAQLQADSVLQFFPQALAYLGLAVWAGLNDRVVQRLGLASEGLGVGLRWGVGTGLILGTINVSVILWLVPFLGGDISFLRETPHARVPPALMLPWVIVLIAIFVEVNFRGFLLGRLLVLSRGRPPGSSRTGTAVAVMVSALIFSFDPFMVATFRHLHWIAVWDGLIWGVLWLRLRTLYATIAAHAVEVIVMYSIIKHVLQ